MQKLQNGIFRNSANIINEQVKKFIETFAVEEVTEALKLYPYTIRRLCREGEIPAFSAQGGSASGRKFGDQWRFDVKEIEEWRRNKKENSGKDESPAQKRK